MSSQGPRLVGSLVVENQRSEADHDAATVLDPETYVAGPPFEALARLRANAPVHPVQLPGLPRAWLLTRHADVRRASRDTQTFSSAMGNTLVKVEMNPVSVHDSRDGFSERGSRVMAALINHTGLCVKDADVSSRFYIEVFGFSHWFQLRVPDRACAELMSLEAPIGLTATYLRHGSWVLELLSYERSPLQGAPRALNELGLTHLSIAVSDVAETVSKALQCGGSVISNVGVAAVITDPDGQKLELVSMNYRDTLPDVPAK